MKMNRSEFLGAAFRVNSHKLAEAFKSRTFIYGTTGNGSIVGEFVNKIGSNIGLKCYDPGRRVNQYIKNNHQMMDLYYGQAETSLHELRDPIIAEFVHYAMKFKGTFDTNTSGRESYLKSFYTQIEGWDKNSPSKNMYNGLTATQEMSRIIRWGVYMYGGTIIFEGKDVFYSQVFDRNAPRVGDTDLEARELFEYFTPNKSNVPFGKGNIIFHWEGREIVPTQSHFLENWVWAPHQTHSFKNHGKNINRNSLLPIWNNFLPRNSHNGLTGQKKFRELVRLKIQKDMFLTE